MSLAISIINYKTPQLTTKCLRSILGFSWKTKVNIWLVDNNSGDNSVEILKSEFPQVNIIESSQNLGFAGGHNLVLPKITEDFLLVLNSDAEVTEGLLDSMVNFMETSGADIASCKVVDFEGKLQPNSGDFPFGQALTNWLFNLEIFGYFEPSFHRNDKEYYSKVHAVDWVSGSFMMVKKSVIDKIGLFDDRFFMYTEDVEFCLRARKNGFKIMLNPNCVVKHLSGGSADDPKFRQWSGELKNLILLYKNEFGEGSSLLLRILIYVATTLRMIAFLLIGRFQTAKTYAKIIKTI